MNFILNHIIILKIMNLIKEKFMEIDLLNFMGLSSEAYTLCDNLWE